MATALAEDELLLEARLPLLPGDARFGFYEFSRRAGDYAIAMALVTYPPAGRRRSSSRVSAIGGAEARPRRMAEAEAALAGQQARRRGLPRRGAKPPPTPSIRWKTSTRTPNSAATWCAR